MVIVTPNTTNVKNMHLHQFNVMTGRFSHVIKIKAVTFRGED